MTIRTPRGRGHDGKGAADATAAILALTGIKLLSPTSMFYDETQKPDSSRVQNPK